MAANRLKIVVTQEHIDKGERIEPDLCPLALATGRRVVYRGVLVESRTSMVVDYYPSIRMLRFMKRFDTKRSVKPTTFLLTKKV